MQHDHVIIYDGSCPMCAWYTGLFVKTGMLPADGRQTFSNMSDDVYQVIDQERSRHEIPLVNRKNGQVLYGIDALLAVLGKRFPLLTHCCRVRPVDWFIRRLYRLVSYNRRVIVAATDPGARYDSSPAFNLKYRAIFLVMGFIINSLGLVALQATVFTNSLFAGGGWLQTQLAHLAFVACNLFVATHYSRVQAYEYIGQINMVALVASLLLSPLILINLLFETPAILNNIGFTIVLFVLIREYFRRMRFAGMIQSASLAVSVNVFCFILFLLYLSNQIL